MGAAPAVAVGMGLLNNAQKRTQQYQAARQAEDLYDTQSDAFNKYLQELQEFLDKKSATLKDTATGDAKVATNRFSSNLARAGITGGRGTGSVGGKGLYSIEKALQSRYGEIEGAVAEQMAQANLQKTQALAPLDAAVNTSKNALRGSEVNFNTNSLGTNLQNIAPALAPAFATGITGLLANQFGGANVDINQALTKNSVDQFLNMAGVDPKVFATGGSGLPQQVGDDTYTPTTDIFGNVTYTKSPGTAKPNLSARDKATTYYQREASFRDSAVSRLSPEQKDIYITELEKYYAGLRPTMPSITKNKKEYTVK